MRWEGSLARAAGEGHQLPGVGTGDPGRCGWSGTRLYSIYKNFMRLHAILWIRFYEVLSDSMRYMKFCQILWDSMSKTLWEFYEILSDSLRFYENSMRFCQILWDSVRFYEILADSMRFCQILQEFYEILSERLCQAHLLPRVQGQLYSATLRSTSSCCRAWATHGTRPCAPSKHTMASACTSSGTPSPQCPHKARLPQRASSAAMHAGQKRGCCGWPEEKGVKQRRLVFYEYDSMRILWDSVRFCEILWVRFCQILWDSVIFYDILWVRFCQILWDSVRFYDILWVRF